MKLALIVVCLGLAAVIARSAVQSPLEAVAAQRAAPSDANQAQAADREPIESLVAAILERPLFNPDRRGPAADLAADETDSAPAAAPGHASLPRLAGIMMAPDGAQALFARDGGAYFTARAGSVVDGWTVIEIDQRRVIVANKDGQLALAPTGTKGANAIVEPSVTRIDGPAARMPVATPAAFQTPVSSPEIAPLHGKIDHD